MPARLVAIRAAVAALLVAAPAVLRAQVGSSTDILTGTVADSTGRPLEGATVEATSVDTRITRHTTTGGNGRYTIVFPDGGGQYRVTVRYLGMSPATFVVARQADEDRLVRDVRMSPTAFTLEAVTVRARRRRAPQDERPTPGSTGRAIGGDQAARLPVDASDMNDLAALAPGVVPIAGSDSTAAGFSVAGLPPTANNITVDGLSFGATSIPQDAVRATRVVTNTYDVARGQFMGAQVATTTRGGTNVPAGSFNYSLRDRGLAFGVDPNSPFAAGYTQNQLGGGFGGPIVHDKLFGFAALQWRRRSDVQPSLLDANAVTLQRLGASPDSVSRFLDDMSAFGIPAAPDGFDPNRLNQSVSGLARVDWLLSENHTLMLRGDWRWNDQDPSRVGTLALPSSGGTQTGHGGGIMASLTSRLGTVINELRAYGSADVRRSEPFLSLPQGRVQLASAFGDSSRAVSTIVFGGNAGLPQTGDTKSLEASDELSWLPGDASHRIKLGVLVDAQRSTQDVTTNREGTFTFHSLEDLEANRPSSFTRTLAPTLRAATSFAPAVYLGDTWRRSRALQLTYGVRVEHSSFGGAPARNALVDSLFALRTDRFPSETHVSPRVGFTWMLGGADGGAVPTVVRGGVGEFRSPIQTGLLSAAQGATGTTGAESQLVCVGDGVPAPDWGEYLSDPAAIPTACTVAVEPVADSARPAVTAFAPGYGAPRAWRASLGVQRRFLDRYGASIDVSLTRGTNLGSVRDVNLDPTPRFGLADEGGRPVFVPASAIVPATGTAQFFDSRLHPELGYVLAMGSGLESRSTQVTLSLNGFTMGGLVFQASYTWLRARDQSSFTCCSAVQGLDAPTTAGNPNVPEWATSDNQRTHSFLLTATYPVTSAVEVTAVGRLLSGAPFTPMVASDINGDGLRNDRAFIFDPATTTDTAVASAMRRVLTDVPSGVRQCLTSQLGGVAARNSCTGPWQPSLDLQLNIRPSAFGLDRRLTLSVVTVNMLAGVDQLLHGSNDLRGWGSFTRPDGTLLYVRGFDPATNEYRYQVNERFGTTRGAAAVFRAPFQLAIQLRYTVGPDQARDRLRGIFGRGGARGGPGGGADAAAGNAADFADRFARMVPNPVARLLEMRDTLALTDDQAARLGALRDSLDRENGALADSIRAAIQRAGDRPDPARLFATIRPSLQAARENARKALDAARGILTAEQWKKVPEDARTTGVRRPRRDQ
ncbi:MAG TPA: carboxypeptidase regulatory-like domain-containing protein [Gemmatimonadaceae bacterium]|nr:carboxypeptidase regulatory-like domain-containing protein [Gemmatimonadaceae bacterium]